MEEDEVTEVERALLHHLASVDDAVVGALDGEGFFVPMPAGLPPIRFDVFRAEHAIATVAGSDVVNTIALWELVLAEGPSEGEVTLVDGARAHLALFDVRATHGVVICVGTPVGGALDANVGASPDALARAPRVCRLRKDARANIIDVDSAVEPMLGWSRDEIIDRRQVEFMHPDDEAMLVETWISLLANPGSPQRLRARHRRRDGSYVWVELINHNRLHDADHGDVTCDIIDITEQVEAEQALAEREAMLNTLTEMLTELTESLPSGVAQFSASGALVYSNSRLFDILDAAEATTLDDLLVHVDPDHRAEVRDAVVAACLNSAEAEDIEVDVMAPDGRRARVCQFVVRPLRDRAHGAVLSVSDITDTVERRADLEHRATRDALTGCLNRSAITTALRHSLDDDSSGTGVVFVDLDDFKAVNDALGHGAGDELLQLVAERLQGAVRERDLVGRIGGDEFLVVCPTIATAAAAEALAERIGEALRQPALIAEQPLLPSASIGSAWAPSGSDADELVRRADEAMYAAKQRSRTSSH